MQNKDNFGIFKIAKLIHNMNRNHYCRNYQNIFWSFSTLQKLDSCFFILRLHKFIWLSWLDNKTFKIISFAGFDFTTSFFTLPWHYLLVGYLTLKSTTGKFVSENFERTVRAILTLLSARKNLQIQKMWQWKICDRPSPQQALNVVQE